MYGYIYVLRVQLARGTINLLYMTRPKVGNNMAASTLEVGLPSACTRDRNKIVMAISMFPETSCM